MIELSLLCFDRLHMESLLPRVLPLVDSVHLDIMDGVFTADPGGYAPDFINDFDGGLPKHVHAMVTEPLVHLAALENPTTYSFHIEATPEPGPVLDELERRGIGAGLALNPETPVEAAAPWLHRLERVVLMAVPPGKSGQPYLLRTSDKLRALRQMDTRVDIVIDGGMHERTIGEVVSLGANACVVCSVIVKSDDPERKVAQLRESTAASLRHGA